MAIVTSAVAGLRAARMGATMLQLRDHAATARELEIEAELLVEITSVPILVSSRIDVARAAGAAGVNLPEADVGVGDARRLLGMDALVGRSVHSLAAATDAATGGADYVLYGPVFATGSHPATPPTGLAALRELVAAVRVPVLAIGGVNRQNAAACLDAGASGYASVSLFMPHPA
jgi:thiamine-phosphate diphosphorylase